MRLFPPQRRSDPSPADHTERTYAFLCRVDDPAFEAIRMLLDEWFIRYRFEQGEVEARDLAARFKSNDDLQFEAAFWELYLHEAHRRLGFSVTALRLRHVAIGGRTSR